MSEINSTSEEKSITQQEQAFDDSVEKFVTSTDAAKQPDPTKKPNWDALDLPMQSAKRNIPTDSVEQMAYVCHQANKAWCELNGDFSQKDWSEAEPWQVESAVNGVLHRLKHFNAGPDHSHNNWMKEKLANGWKYGPTKNTETKEHPCLVPYAELPQAQQLKDQLFCAIVDTLKNRTF